MIALFKTTYLDLPTDQASHHGKKLNFRAYQTVPYGINLTHTLAQAANTCFLAPKIPFWLIYSQYLRTIYPDMKEAHYLKLAQLTGRYLNNVRGVAQNRSDYLSCQLDDETLSWLISEARRIDTVDFPVGEALTFEALLADYLAGGKYQDTFVGRLRELCEDSLLTCIKEVQREFLFKYEALKDWTDVVGGLGEFIHDPNLNSLGDVMCRYDIRGISCRIDEFYRVYRKGYDAPFADNLYLISQYINVLMDARKSGDYRKLIEDDIQRKFTILFAHGQCADKMNPYLIEHIYEMHRTKSPALKLFLLR